MAERKTRTRKTTIERKRTEALSCLRSVTNNHFRLAAKEQQRKFLEEQKKILKHFLYDFRTAKTNSKIY